MELQDHNLQWNDSLNGNYLWSNTNFGEAVTETMTPMTWSVIRFSLDDWVFLPGLATVGNIGGLPYINMSIFATLFQFLGRSQRQLLDLLDSTMYMQLPAGMEIPRISLSWKEIFNSLLYLTGVQSRLMRGRRYLAVYLASNPGWFEKMRARIQEETSGWELVNLWEHAIKPHIKAGVWTALGTGMHATEYTAKLQRGLISMVGPEDASALISNLSAQADLLPSLGPSVGLAQIANGQGTREEYIQKYGHRGPHEFELSRPRPAEDRDWIDRQLAQYQKSPLATRDLFKQQQEAFAAAWGRFSARHSGQAKRVLRRIQENSRRSHLREQARSEYVRDRWLARIFAQRAGELTGLGDDIFFLTLEEALQVLSSESLPSGLIADRQETYWRYRALPSYPAVICGRFDPFEWASAPQRRSDYFDQHTSPSVQETKPITGAAGSAGCVVGLARVLADIEQGDQFQAGEILVARMTDIGWTLLFPRAAAVVTDIGAPLSHAAIVARELGIPAVVGCGDATSRLRTGDKVEVDGSAGRVTVLARA